MKQVEFKEQNGILLKPENMTDEQCGTLPCYRDGSQVISKWILSEEEKKQILENGFIWVSVLSGISQPPIALWIGEFENKPKI